MMAVVLPVVAALAPEDRLRAGMVLAIPFAANIGGIATTPIVAGYHNRKLVPAGILMALIGYAVGNYGALAAAWLCWLVSGS